MIRSSAMNAIIVSGWFQVRLTNNERNIMNPDQTINLNQNAAQCIHSASHWGKETYYNICNHTQMDVPWGGMDWLFNILGTSILVIGAIGLIVVVVAVINAMMD